METKSALSLRVDPHTKATMSLHEEINWSAVIRKAIQQKLRELEFAPIDRKLAQQALSFAAKLRAKRPVTKKLAAEIIREWREKRR